MYTWSLRNTCRGSVFQRTPHAHLLRTSLFRGSSDSFFPKVWQEAFGRLRVGRLLKLAAISSACNWAVAPRSFFRIRDSYPPLENCPISYSGGYRNYRMLLAQDATSKKGLRVHPPTPVFVRKVRPEIRKRDSHRWGRSLLMF